MGTPQASDTASPYWLEPRQVAIAEADHHEVHQQEVHRGVAARSPIPRAQPWTREAPARTAAMQLTERHLTVAVPVPVDADLGARIASITLRSETHEAVAPHGVAWPTVSARHMRLAPAGLAPRRACGWSPGGPRGVLGDEHHLQALLQGVADPFRVRSSRKSSSQPSTYCRMGDEPMNRLASMGTPVACAMRAMGSMSRCIVRAAQLARTFMRAPTFRRSPACS